MPGPLHIKPAALNAEYDAPIADAQAIFIRADEADHVVVRRTRSLARCPQPLQRAPTICHRQGGEIFGSPSAVAEF
jgi:hypothetical protein